MTQNSALADGGVKSSMANFALIKERLDLYEKLMRLDKPIGILLLLWPTLWALWIAGEWPAGLDRRLDFRARHGADAFGRLRRSTTTPIAISIRMSSAPRTGRWRRARSRAREALHPGRLPGAVRVPADPAAADTLLVRPGGRGAVPRGQLSLHQALLRHSAGLSRRRLRLRHPDGLCRAAGQRAGDGLVAAGGEHLLGDRLRHRVRAWSIREDDLRIGIKTSAITFGRFDIAAVMLCYGVTLALLAYVGYRYGFGWPYCAGLAVAAAHCRLSLHADPRPRAHALLQGLPAQQLVRRGGVRRHRRRLSGCTIRKSDHERCPRSARLHRPTRSRRRAEAHRRRGRSEAGDDRDLRPRAARRRAGAAVRETQEAKAAHDAGAGQPVRHAAARGHGHGCG